MIRAFAVLALVPVCFDYLAAQVLTTPAPGKTVISKASYDLWANTSVMVISSRGTVTLMDGFLTLPQIRPDVLTVSHFHGDHFDGYLLGFVPCARSTAKAESFAFKDVKVEGLASTHGGPIDPSWPTNVIYVLTVDGLRIAHLGDFGQIDLTDEQQRALDGVDVLIAPVTHLLVPEEKAVALFRQIRPKMFLPTHCTRRGRALLQAWADELTTVNDRIEIGRGDLTPGRTRLLVLKRGDAGFLWARFLLLEFPTYPITKFVAVLILLLWGAMWAVRRLRRKRMPGLT
jgi:L-ascorbate metabolism protein UlaG (beta-lactamase superfamily)